MKKTLLELAKEVKSSSKFTCRPSEERIDLIIALANEEISIRQAAKALSINHGGIPNMFMSVMRRSLMYGLIEIKKIK